MVHIKDIIEGFFKQAQTNQNVYDAIMGVLGGVLDEQTQQQITLKHVKKDTVFLKAHSSSAVYNFNLKKEKVLRRIQEKNPGITQIQIKVN